MLVLSRQVGKVLLFRLSDDIDPNTPIGEVLGNEPIQVLLLADRFGGIRLDTEVPLKIDVAREEIASSQWDGS